MHALPVCTAPLSVMMQRVTSRSAIWRSRMVRVGLPERL